MKSRVITMAFAAACLCSLVASAGIEGGPLAAKVHDFSGEARLPPWNGTLGSPSISVHQTDDLEVRVDFSATTNGSVTAHSPLAAVFLYNQIYDYPWDGGLPTWTVPGGNTVVLGDTTIIPSATAGGSFALSTTFTLPHSNVYQVFGMAWAGIQSGTTADSVYLCPGWFCRTQSTYLNGPTTYLPVPPTPTINPNAGGPPIPMLSMPALFILGMVMAGVGVLLLRRS